jgi:hypothetical protein
MNAVAGTLSETIRLESTVACRDLLETGAAVQDDELDMWNAACGRRR